ncbi:hypothetical protein KIW84_071092 [Lathyrus oleraceus]|uniref:Uncharacterized protein n=1 Tax=Pisum sativum TaxID=3888 RepID=A0A9D4VJM7_PEA|nr:hypothetical protein KIW84_071092 [Pisum sativum]
MLLQEGGIESEYDPMLNLIQTNISMEDNNILTVPLVKEELHAALANLSEVRYLIKLLNTYAEASGKETNLTKSEVFFSRTISSPAKEDLARIMGVRHVMGTRKCLGFPSMIGRIKKAIVSFIKDRIGRK